MIHNRVDIITLGCSKNLVDSEVLLRQFEANGYTCIHDSDHPQGEIVVVNTCGFIGDAKQESINTILQLSEAKRQGIIGKLFVMGCLSQRYHKELQQELPLVDKYYGKFTYKDILAEIGKPLLKVKPQRTLTTPSHYAYVKIAEGCDRRCAYCAIPLITGHHRSRPIDEILEEVQQLVAQGVKEFQVIEQELTYYGVDIDGRQHIAELIDRMAQIPGVRWIRLHYAYPNNFPYELLDVIQRHSNVCNYLDIALQHISNHMLRRMLRHISKEETLQLLNEIRHRVPGITLRTTLMVGFPGETQADFEELLDFVRTQKFERMGAFAYSEEEGTYSATHYKDNISKKEKQRRLDQLMQAQAEVNAELMAQKTGTVMQVIVDRIEGDYYIARGEDSSPEVDPEVLIPLSAGCTVGEFYKVRIIDTFDFDLFAELV